jgi:hypothetical protein
VGLLTRDNFRHAAGAPKRATLLTLHYPPELDGDVYVKPMGAKELSIFNEGLFQGNGKKRKVVTINIQAKMAVRCLVDAELNGTRLFSDDDAEWLGECRADAVGKIFKKIKELSGLDDDDEDDDSGK